MYKTYESYRKAWSEAESEDPPIPLNLDLELASVCNLRCPFCFIPDPKFEEFISQKAEDGKPLRRVMPLVLAERLICEALELGIPAIKFNWRGESTLHPNYSEIVNRAANCGFIEALDDTEIFCREKDGFREIDWSRVDKTKTKFIPAFHELLANTNANCSDKAIDGLMATTKCMVSLDSMSLDTYNIMRAGGDLDRAKHVIWELVRRGHPNLWIRRVLTKENIHEDFFGMVKKEWGNKVHVSQHYCFDRNAKSKNEISGCDHDQNMPRRYCSYPSQRLVISSSGKAYPCCIDLHETMPVGDTLKQSLADIWNGEPIKKLRQDLRTNDPKKMTETCKNCESWMSFNVPQRDFVKDVEVLESHHIGEGSLL